LAAFLADAFLAARALTRFLRAAVFCLAVAIRIPPRGAALAEHADE
jgi:hypothetical protein